VWKDDKGKYCVPKGNNGVGNGIDPPPPGIGNSGNDGDGKTPGNPGGNDTSPGKNQTTQNANEGGADTRDRNIWDFDWSQYRNRDWGDD
jgi:hypothetical protein